MVVSVERLEDARKRLQKAAQAAALHFDRGDHAELADVLLEQLGARDEIVYTEGSLYLYQAHTGTWERLSTEQLARMVKGFAGATKGEDGILRVRTSDADGAIRFAGVEVYRERFFEGPRAIGFADGALVVDATGAIRRLPHMPDNRLRFALPFAFDAAAPRPRFEALLAEWFADADDAAERIALLQEFVGACLVGHAVVLEACLICYGPGGNGKSEFLRIVSALFPPHATATLAPQTWSERFAIAALAGVLVNIVDEMPDHDFIESNQFKAIVSGKLRITAEQKYKDAFTFAPRAGHIFAANRLPSTGDVSEGFWRRFIVCAFTRRFEGSEKRADAGAEVLANELPGVAAWAIAGAQRVMTQRGYTIPPSHNVAMCEWRTHSDSVAAYIEERCSRIGANEPIDRWTRGGQLYAAYRGWANDNGYKAVSSKTFSSRMGALGLWMLKRSDANYYPVSVRL